MAYKFYRDNGQSENFNFDRLTKNDRKETKARTLKTRIYKDIRFIIQCLSSNRKDESRVRERGIESEREMKYIGYRPSVKCSHCYHIIHTMWHFNFQVPTTSCLLAYNWTYICYEYPPSMIHLHLSVQWQLLHLLLLL